MTDKERIKDEFECGDFYCGYCGCYGKMRERILELEAALQGRTVSCVCGGKKEWPGDEKVREALADADSQVYSLSVKRVLAAALRAKQEELDMANMGVMHHVKMELANWDRAESAEKALANEIALGRKLAEELVAAEKALRAKQEELKFQTTRANVTTLDLVKAEKSTKVAMSGLMAASADKEKLCVMLRAAEKALAEWKVGWAKSQRALAAAQERIKILEGK